MKFHFLIFEVFFFFSLFYIFEIGHDFFFIIDNGGLIHLKPLFKINKIFKKQNDIMLSSSSSSSYLYIFL